MILLLPSCAIEKRKYLPGYHIDWQLQGHQKSRSNHEVHLEASPQKDAMSYTKENEDKDLSASSEHGGIDFIYLSISNPECSAYESGKCKQSDQSTNSNTVAQEPQPLQPDTLASAERSTAQNAGIAATTGVVFGLNQLAIDIALATFARNTGSSLSLVPAISIFGLSAAGMIILTSILVAVTVFLILTIQKRKRAKAVSAKK